jgi:hypothetical protein
MSTAAESTRNKLLMSTSLSSVHRSYGEYTRFFLVKRYYADKTRGGLEENHGASVTLT